MHMPSHTSVNTIPLWSKVVTAISGCEMQVAEMYCGITAVNLSEQLELELGKPIAAYSAQTKNIIHPNKLNDTLISPVYRWRRCTAASPP